MLHGAPQPRFLKLFARLVILFFATFFALSAPLAARSQPGETGSVWLPVVAAPQAPISYNSGRLGLEASNLAKPDVSQGVIALDAAWLRRNGLHWKDVQAEPGAEYNWQAPGVQALEADMIMASQNGLRLIVIIHRSPHWAVAPYSADCAPINPAHYASFVRFVEAAVARYSRPPYNVRFWEIGNEPDAPIFPFDSPFGCWGVVGDPFYGGQAYGNLLNAVYPAIKAVDPQAVVLNGGLLLERPYDPANPADTWGRFFEGMLLAGAGESFDMLSYHSYSFYNNTVDGTIGDPDWKPGFLRDVMQHHGVDKPLISTETALLCSIPNNTCMLAQADYAGRALARAYRDDLAGWIWYIYDSDSFNATALIEPDQPAQTRPAYRAIQYANQLLRDAEYVGMLSDQPAGVTVLHFRDGAKTIYVLWSATIPYDVFLSVPAAGQISCTQRDGVAVPCSRLAGNQVRLRVDSATHYVVHTP